MPDSCRHPASCQSQAYTLKLLSTIDILYYGKNTINYNVPLKNIYTFIDLSDTTLDWFYSYLSDSFLSFYFSDTQVKFVCARNCIPHGSILYICVRYPASLLGTPTFWFLYPSRYLYPVLCRWHANLYHPFLFFFQCHCTYHKIINAYRKNGFSPVSLQSNSDKTKILLVALML